MYEIQSRSDFQAGATLIVRIPEETLDKKALYTLLSDRPDFILPFRHKSVDGQIEFTYQIGNRSKLAYISGNRSPVEYADLWVGIVQPLLDCGDWFLSPYSFVLKAEHLYCDKTSKVISFVYIPSIQTYSDYDMLKDMITTVAKQNHATDVNLENKVIWAIQDFNPVTFLQLVKPYNPQGDIQAGMQGDIQTGLHAGIHDDMHADIHSDMHIGIQRDIQVNAQVIQETAHQQKVQQNSQGSQSHSYGQSTYNDRNEQHKQKNDADIVASKQSAGATHDLDDIAIHFLDKGKATGKNKQKNSFFSSKKESKKETKNESKKESKDESKNDINKGLHEERNKDVRKAIKKDKDTLSATRVKEKSGFFGKKNKQQQEIIQGAAAMSGEQGFKPEQSAFQGYSSSDNNNVSDVTELDFIETDDAKFRYVGNGDHPRVIIVSVAENDVFTIGRFDASVGTKQSSFEFDKRTKAVSRRHAAIERRSDGYNLVDLSSSAGTFINGQKLPPNAPYKLERGYRVSFGHAGADYIWEE